jgi:hypothetical protein
MHGKGVTLEAAVDNVFQGFGVSTRGGEGSRKGRYDPSLKTDRSWPGWGRQHASYAVGKAKSAKPVEGAEADVDLDIREVQEAAIPRARRPSKAPEAPEYRDWQEDYRLSTMPPAPPPSSLAMRNREHLAAVRPTRTLQPLRKSDWPRRLKELQQVEAGFGLPVDLPRSIRPQPPRPASMPPAPEPSAAESKEAIKAARAARRAAKGQKKPGRKPGPEAQVAAEQAAFDALVARVEAKEARQEEAPPPPREEPPPPPRKPAATKRTATGERVSLPDAPRPGKLPF